MIFPIYGTTTGHYQHIFFLFAGIIIIILSHVDLFDNIVYLPNSQLVREIEGCDGSLRIIQ